MSALADLSSSPRMEKRKTHMAKSAEHVIEAIVKENLLDEVTNQELLEQLYRELDAFSNDSSVQDFLSEERYHDQYVRIMGKNPRQS